MNYPYMLIIRNSSEGMIWQAYTVHNELEEKLITRSATKNGFLVSREPLNYTEESSPGWRESIEWKKYVESETKSGI